MRDGSGEGRLVLDSSDGMRFHEEGAGAGLAINRALAKQCRGFVSAIGRTRSSGKRSSIDRSGESIP